MPGAGRQRSGRCRCLPLGGAQVLVDDRAHTVQGGEFAWPGVGRLIVAAIYARDYPIVQAGVFAVAVGYTAINLLVDVLYAYLNPRVRFE